MAGYLNICILSRLILFLMSDRLNGSVDLCIGRQGKKVGFRGGKVLRASGANRTKSAGYGE